MVHHILRSLFQIGIGGGSSVAYRYRTKYLDMAENYFVSEKKRGYAETM
jgi:hypothetical protein